MKCFRSAKTFRGFPCTHRQWRADSHCRFVHGYSREFHLEFSCRELTREMWVMNFGGLKAVRAWLEHYFDHTFLVAHDDPCLDDFLALDHKGVIQLRIMPNAGMEGTAKFVYDHVDKIVARETKNRVWVSRVEVRENENNSAVFIPPHPAGP
ncbi:MAG: 6-carboxytetrahydropterin synthase [Bacteriovoracales bacterium]|nr:6-carboxytetrahydropterin synthase [Bacteriovoracales bacterium]